jgi:uncharacterized membrane protein YecN with MAPEG domain
MTLSDFIGSEAAAGALDALSLWVGLLVLWLVVLSFGVVGQRRRLKVAFGDGGHVSLTAAARAFGNAAEYVPAGLIALLLLALTGATPLLIHILGSTLLVGRVIHAGGLLFQKGPSLGRILGMALTYAVLLFAAGLLIGQAVG